MQKEVATLEAWRGDTLVLARPWTYELPLASVTRLEVSRGRKSHTLIGLGIGFIGGAAIGGLVATGFDEGGGDWGNYFLVGAAIGGAAFGAIGAGIGALVKSDRWEEVPLDQLRVSLVPQRDGRFALGLSVSFQ
jgi:MFS family permease